MRPFERSQILPALLRPGMYVGEQGDRTVAEWHADAVPEYLNAAFDQKLVGGEDGEPRTAVVRL